MEFSATLKAQVKEILVSPELSSLEAILSCLIQPEEDLDAKAIFDHCSRHYPNTLSLKLTHLLESSTQSHLTAVYATFLYGLLTRNSSKLSPMILTELKPLLFACFQRQTLETILKPLSQSIGVVAFRDSNTKHGEWQELLDYIVSSADSEDDKYKESGLMLFSNLPMKMGRFLKPKFDSLYSAIMKHLSSPTMNIRSFAFRLSLILAMHLEGFDDHDSIQYLLPAMLKFLIELLNDREDASVEQALKDLDSLVTVNASFFTKHLKHVCETMIQIAEADYVGKEMRNVALGIIRELEDSLTKEMFSMFQNLNGEILHRLISASMGMLLSFEDDPALYYMDAEKSINGEQIKSFDLGLFLLDQISAAVDGALFLPITLKLTQQYLAAPEWQKHHAAMITLSMIAEGCSEEMISSLGQVVPMISNSLQELHPRVRLGAVTAVRSLSLELAPTFQALYHHKMLPALNEVIEDSHFPLLQTNASMAIRFFIKGCRPNDLTPYLEEIVSKLLVLLQNEKQPVQEEAMSTLATAATFSQDQFHICYDVTMASLKAILFNETDASKFLFRATSAECISCVAIAVGEEKFMNDATKVIETLMSLQQSLSETDYSIRIHLLKAWMGLCICLGENIVTYITEFMPIFIRSADLSIDKNTGEQSDILKEKALACNLLSCCARLLKEKFFTWVNQVAKILVPLLEFHPHFETIKASVSAMPELLRSAMLAIQKGESGEQSVSCVHELVILIIPALVEALKKEQQKEICAGMLNSLNQCAEVSGLFFTTELIKQVADGMKDVLTVHSFRNLELAGGQAGDDFDLEEEKNRKKQLEDLLHQARNCLITMIKVFKAKFLPYFKTISAVITAMLAEDRTAIEKKIAFSIVNCVIQQCQEAAHKCVDAYLPLLLKACDDEKFSDVKQEAANGIGVCAEFAQSNFKTIAEAAVVSLNSVIRHPDSSSSENRKAYDIAVSALGKICKFHRESINAPQVVPIWLSYLPIKDDSAEAKVVHEQLCSMVERSDKELLGPDNLHLPKIIEVFTEVVAERDNLATGETADRMVALLRQFEKTY
ncbi:hypothetical protein FH972_007774 [Carpinus fangiana]|uniref:DUF577 domain-containing protein n=1 Tax=Carpinus fangiana TaxID=176857 RepID=A0A5N6QWI3_9ROSI|nr:hypothetical protein FH972_007774 [Carpinus fangiana]